MYDYEITYLADPKLEEADQTKLNDSVSQMITDFGGTVDHISALDTPGSRRQLNYPINNHKVAWLRVIQAQLDPKKVAEVREQMHKQPGILRTRIINTPRRDEISPALLEIFNNKPTLKPTLTETSAPTKIITTEEVDEKIEAALDEEVK